MEQQEYMDRVHAEILTIMDEVHRICVENKLKYYLIGGTLLGAVRHGGFIPWDDDLDITMPWDDFIKFKEITKHHNSGYRLVYCEGYKHYPLYFMKYENRATVFYEGMMWEPENKPGIFVDIFPLNYSSGSVSMLQMQKRVISRLTDLLTKKVSSSQYKLSFVEKILLPVVPASLLRNIRRWTACLGKSSKAAYFANFGSQYSIIKQHFPREAYGEGQLIKFEDRFYYAPDDPEYVLIKIFGNNYMQIPPIEKRRTHYPKMVQFSNHEVIEFEEPQHRVTVNDQ